jgi:prepilin-type N-terminal cleavage/methylation domain-containing protein
LKTSRLICSAPFAAGAGSRCAARSRAGFTMIEIALCLAIIGFALVAIIGVLPIGLNVQRDNRQETIINQDAVMWMNAIRNGSRGFEDLTNYVMVISNYATRYVQSGNNWVLDGSPNPNIHVYARTFNLLNNSPVNPPFLLTNGQRIIGLMSAPRIEWTSGSSFTSNFTVAHVRALSGVATEKVPQNDPDVLESAFAYRLIPEIHTYVPFDWDSTNYLAYLTNAAFWVPRSNHWRVVTQLHTNTTDIRLNFRWALLPNGVGNGRQTFRLFCGGGLLATNELVLTNRLYFLQPSVYYQAQTP